MNINYVKVAYITIKDYQFMLELKESISHWSDGNNGFSTTCEELADFVEDYENEEEDNQNAYLFVKSVLDKLENGTGDVVFYCEGR